MIILFSIFMHEMVYDCVVPLVNVLLPSLQHLSQVNMSIILAIPFIQ